jgi:cysteine-rich repeat protein
MADTVNYGGANQCLIWQAFAKRGMGELADDTGNPRRLKVTEDFTVPSACLPVCGNGVFDAGEQCDDGNTLAGDCCSASCQFESAATECRSSADVCDPAEFCTGASGTCPDDAVEADTTECRSSAGACDLAEFCDGAGVACPADSKNTGECRAAAGSCDVAEICDGVANDCPADAVDVGLCGPGDACNSVACVAKECQYPPVADGTDCSDADLCNGDETCQSGLCTAGSPLVCEDGDVCTEDSCDPETGCVNDPILTCENTPVPVPIFPAGGVLLIALLGAALGVGGVAASRSKRTLAG